jgi:transposase-like protein
MDHDTHGRSTAPDPESADPLTELLRRGARDLLRQAVEAELQVFLGDHADYTLENGRRAVVRNGYQPARTVQTGIGDVDVQLPKTRDRSGSGIHFTSNLLPPYLRRTRSVEELLPWLYLKGVSSGDFQEALTTLLGEQAPGLSASTLGRLKQQWLTEHAEWRGRDLSARRYVYWWANGVHFNLRGEDDDRACLLVIIGVLPDGTKEFVALDDGVRESSQSWYELLVRMRDSQGLTAAPRLAIGDGALGFWKALVQVYPATRGQRCWVHKTANVLNKLPKRSQPKAKSALQAIWMAESRDDAERAFDAFATAWGDKYPKAVETLQKDREALLAFYDFPAKHWQSIRTTNPIESTFATVRLRTAKTRGCVTRNTILSLAFKLGQSAEKRWRRLRGYQWLDELERGVTFIDGVAQYEDTNDHRSAA